MANVRVFCPTCSKPYRVKQQVIGVRAKCPSCENTFILQTTSDRSEDQTPESDQYPMIRDEGLRQLAAGNLEGAINSFVRAAHLRSTSAEAAFYLGSAFEQAGKIEAARLQYSRALKIIDDRPESWDRKQVSARLRSLPANPPKRSDFSVGDVIRSSTTNSVYRIDQILKGGFGAVYIATEETMKYRCALKTYQTEYMWNDEHRDRFEREALTCIMLDKHPNIVSVQVMIEVEGFPCLELEYVSGGDLQQLLAKGPLETKRALSLALDFCDGMNYVHERLGLVHRDVKPANCLLDDQGRLKITDFGLARAFGKITDEQVVLQDVDPRVAANFTTRLGTTSYKAPEQERRDGIIDTRTDIYAFGIMLFEMLTNFRPDYGVSALSTIGTASKDFDLDADLLELILHCIQPTKEDRPPSFVHLRESLGSCYQRITASPPPKPRPAEPMSPGDLKNKGIALGALRRYEQEIECYDRALAISSQDSELWKNKGVALRLLDRTSEAVVCYDRGLQIDPNDPELWMNRGVAMGTQCRYEEEIECYDQAMRLSPDDSELLKNKGVALGELELFEEELACYEQALRIAPRDHELWQNKGVVLRLLDKPKEAIECYQRALEIAPRESEIWQNMGVAFAMMESLEDAIDCYQRGLEISPNDPDLLRNLGAAKGAQGLYQEELACYDKAIEVSPHDGDLWLNKSIVLDCLGRKEEADQCHRKAMSLKKRIYEE